MSVREFYAHHTCCLTYATRWKSMCVWNVWNEHLFRAIHCRKSFLINEMFAVVTLMLMRFALLCCHLNELTNFRLNWLVKFEKWRKLCVLSSENLCNFASLALKAFPNKIEQFSYFSLSIFRSTNEIKWCRELRSSGFIFFFFFEERTFLFP